MSNVALSNENELNAEVAERSDARTKFKVPAENIERLRARVDEVNRRVARLVKRGYQVEPIAISVGELRVEKRGKVEEIYADVELLSPEPPKVDGWQFVAVLSHVEDVGTVLRACPGADLAEGELKRYRTADPQNCDHCHAKRRRTDTFVVRDASGSLRQVGRQCLAAYTGIANPAYLCEAAEILCAAGEILRGAEDASGAAGPREYASIASYLPFVACSIREDGWLSRTAAREQGTPYKATASLAQSEGLFASPQQKHVYVPSEKDYSLAAAAIAHCEEIFGGCDVDALSDYESSLRVAMASGVLRPRLEGLVASAIVFYQRDVERRARTESFALRAARSRYQGVAGERRVFEDLRVDHCSSFATDFGAKFLYALSDSDDNMFAYFSTRDLDLAPGQVVSLRGTVKKHELRTPKTEKVAPYQQTLLTRCALCVRARITSREVVKRDLGKRIAAGTDALGYVTHTFVLEDVSVYHLEAADGRRFVVTSRKPKRGLEVGSSAIVEYAAEDLSGKNGGERPASLVEVVRS